MNAFFIQGGAYGQAEFFCRYLFGHWKRLCDGLAIDRLSVKRHGIVYESLDTDLVQVLLQLVAVGRAQGIDMENARVTPSAVG